VVHGMYVGDGGIGEMTMTMTMTMPTVVVKMVMAMMIKKPSLFEIEKNVAFEMWCR
jgi:hypothetical protein